MTPDAALRRLVEAVEAIQQEATVQDKGHYAVSAYLLRAAVKAKNAAQPAQPASPGAVERVGIWPVRLLALREQYKLNPTLHATKVAYINGLEYELQAALTALQPPR